MAEAPDIPLADAIKRLRDEVIGGAQEGTCTNVRFRLGAIHLDLEIAAIYSGGAIGLSKTELVRGRGPFRGLDDLEIATWSGWTGGTTAARTERSG